MTKDYKSLTLQELSILRQECGFLIKHYHDIYEVNIGFLNSTKNEKYLKLSQKYSQIYDNVIKIIEEKIDEYEKILVKN
jgi:hypothetical protein